MQTVLDFDNKDNILYNLKKSYKNVYVEELYAPTYSSKRYSTEDIKKIKDDVIILKSYKERNTENMILKTNKGYMKFSNL